MTLLSLFVGSILAAATPLQVAGVVRVGIPPYEDSERLYRLEGDGWQALNLSEVLTLRRSGEPQTIARLQVTAIKDGYALARRSDSGETYPLKGDLALRRSKSLALPSFPKRTDDVITPAIATLSPQRPDLLASRSLAKGTLHQEPIYFLKESSKLSPAAETKLQSWVTAWGPSGRWVLQVPEVQALSPAISNARVEALKEALKGLGVKTVEVHSIPPEPPARYDSIRVSKES